MKLLDDYEGFCKNNKNDPLFGVDADKCTGTMEYVQVRLPR